MTAPEPETFEEKAALAVSRLRVVVIVIAVTSAVAIGLAAYGFAQAHDALSQQAAQRRDSLLAFCRDQNRRNVNTLAYIHNFGVQAAKRKHISVQASEKGLEPFVLLMDAAIPYQNCQQVVAKAQSK